MQIPLQTRVLDLLALCGSLRILRLSSRTGAGHKWYVVRMKSMLTTYRFPRQIVGAVLLLVSTAGVGFAQGAGAAAPLPTVTGPVLVTPDSHPFLAAAHDLPAIDLAKAGYVEEEFLIAGTANV